MIFVSNLPFKILWWWCHYLYSKPWTAGFLFNRICLKSDTNGQKPSNTGTSWRTQQHKNSRNKTMDQSSSKFSTPKRVQTVPGGAFIDRLYHVGYHINSTRYKSSKRLKCEKCVTFPPRLTRLLKFWIRPKTDASDSNKFVRYIFMPKPFALFEQHGTMGLASFPSQLYLIPTQNRWSFLPVAFLLSFRLLASSRQRFTNRECSMFLRSTRYHKWQAISSRTLAIVVDNNGHVH